MCIRDRLGVFGNMRIIEIGDEEKRITSGGMEADVQHAAVLPFTGETRFISTRISPTDYDKLS